MDSAPDTLREAAQAFASGDHATAICLFEQVVEATPEIAQVWHDLGQAYSGIGRLGEAADAFNTAAKLEPTFAAPCNSLGILSKRAGNLNLAEEYYRQAIKRQPEYPEVYFNLGLLFESMGKLDLARQHYQKAMAQRPDYTQAQNNFAVLLIQSREYDAAEVVLRQALSVSPGSSELLTSLGSCLRNAGRIKEAEEAYSAAIATRGDFSEARWNLALIQLATGNYSEGWKNYRYRPSADRVRHNMPVTELREYLGGQEVILEGEQGLGDELFFLRFVPALMSRGATVSYNGDKRLSAMIDRTLPGLTAKVRHGSAFTLADLAYLLNATEEFVSLQILPREERLREANQILHKAGPPPYTGLTFRAGLKGEGALHKEVPLAKISSLLRDIPGTLVNLQRNLNDDEQSLLEDQICCPVVNFSGYNDEIETMLALMACLDDYIGVSNTNMHLRAAVQRPARVLVPHPPEYRWMDVGNSPWFPEFQVYRQAVDGSWESAFARLSSDLRNAHGRC